ncbi:MAG: pyridoxamine 5'-phosphate oxidase family protein [Pseudomonadota bacterium]|nr:pyridoxamine 5'-phosphate oxidase family protein [Pseudomonadota bacterium]
MGNCPNWADNLDRMLAHGLSEIERAVEDRHHGFRTFGLSTIGVDGAPESRIVVLRKVLTADWVIRFHTDSRSEKVAEIAKDDRVSALLYNKDLKLQIRARGRAALRQKDDTARFAFAEAKPLGRVCYRIQPGPGSAIDEPDAYSHSNSGEAEGTATDPGWPNFCAVDLSLHEIEILYLAHEGHRRARFAKTSAGYAASWLAP